ncbi:uncharacterized protein BO80DRAFT_35972 [Aspergillus ibericus CBS 121593]|uniref:Uncharacterized protein n=1 Tax=Aspergillus ibericus CBS 121593 TaxID=1448316 RepID=A0A395H3Y2_9EURO|nr:hypothetical protein BO80DRAFT_35972 [Aspergillus ibericus CBS 121593]RAL02456.1 hypothetical protein BO80DRAFT_35972 [Aspergillus ibericus CBS 121593]
MFGVEDKSVCLLFVFLLALAAGGHGTAWYGMDWVRLGMSEWAGRDAVPLACSAYLALTWCMPLWLGLFSKRVYMRVALVFLDPSVKRWTRLDWTRPRTGQDG